MPAEKMMVSLKPTNFFTCNPSNDVPRSRQKANQSTLVEDDPVVPLCPPKCGGLKL